ncbi:MAG: hypothetical protein GY866_29125, partial [Proteobacteria bacterium]|nr:hypothetical protein [Pseudomonadota bacterium]
PISFQTQNADWQGEYFGGFVPTCYADDELTQTFGNQEEDSLQEALYYLENDTCSPVGTIQTSPKVGKKAGQSLPESGLRKMMGMM